MNHAQKFMRGPLALLLGLGLIVGFAGYSVKQAKASATKANHAVEVADQTIAALDKKVCAISIPSWEVRQQLIIDTNEHSALSPSIDPNTDLGRALQKQIDAANKSRDDREARDLKLNGAKPCQ